MNKGINKKYSVSTNPFRSIEPKDSKESEIIQITDILVGAIGYQKNSYNLLAKAKKAKKELAKYIAEKAGFADLADNSPWGRKRLTIWNFRLQKR
ncbi:hypothetical protein UZ36_05905 [Candidatus Nitromaritima sp. SCGC AAA799-C22]|nr:hypothetical protein UZ36_05905 [Candidatus Nitromaritima sp. SCGC AAA799-C22]